MRLLEVCPLTRSRPWLAQLCTAIALVLGFATIAQAGTLNLAWDPSPDPDVIGYVVIYGMAPGEYPYALDAGINTTATIYGLMRGPTYYFAVRAYTAQGGISAPSNIVEGFPWNEPPTLQNPGDQYSMTDGTASLFLNASDSDGDPLFYSVYGLPPGLSVDQSTGSITGVPTAAGVFPVHAFSNDGQYDSAEAAFTWRVTPFGAPILQNPGNQSTLEGAAVSLQVVAIDQIAPTFLIYTALNLPPGLSINNPLTGLITGTPQLGSAGVRTVTLAVTDGLNITTLPFTWTVMHPTTTPTITWPAPAAIPYGTALSAAQLNATAHVGATPVIGTFVYTPEAGTALDPGVGQTLSATFTPTGPDAADYTTATATVTIDVLNSAPALLNPGDQVSAEGSTISVRLMAMDTEGNPLIYSVVGLPASLGFDGLTGAISGTLPPGSTGTYPITAQVTDGTLSDSEMFTWTVSPVALEVTPATVASEGTLTVNWQGISSPTPLDWVGLFPVGAPDTGYVTYWWMTGSAAGTRLVTLPTSLPAGSYQLRLFANNSYQRLAVSNTITLTGPGTILSANSPTISLGGTLPVSWQNIATPTPTDWVGVFPLGASDGEFVTWWRTTGSASGTQLVPLPTSMPTGTYQLRLFAENGFQRLALSNGFAVTPVFSVNVASVVSEGTLTASWQGIPAPAVTDWFGLFPAGATDTGYAARWYTTGSASGSLPVSMPPSVTSGAYELRLFAQDSYLRLAVTHAFTVGPWLSASPSPVASGGTLTVNWEGIEAPTPADWFGLFPVGALDTSTIASSVTTGTAGGSQLITVPTLAPAGDYELRLFSQGGFQRLAASNIITVTGSGPILSVNSPTASAGGTIAVGWEGIAAPTATDWFGFFPVGAPDTGYVTWWRTTGTVGGSLLVTVPPFLTPGIYELRLFAQNGFQRLAVTNSFAVASTSVSATPLTVAPGGTETVTIANGPGNARDWVAVYATDARITQYLSWQYLDGSQTVTFTMPTTPGTYNVQLFLNDTYQLVATSPTITIP